jgi:ribose transport system substrate-binding protein
MPRVHLVALAILSLLLPACSTETGKPKVAFVTNNPAQFWTYAEGGCKKAAQDFNVEVLFRRPDKNDAALQKQIIDTLLTRGVKGVAVSVIDPKNQTAYLNEIAGKATVLTQDNDAPESQRACYIGTNNYEAGKAAGELVKKALPGGGVVAVFVGQVDAENARQRFQGVIDALADAKDAKGPMLGKYRLHGDGPFTDGVDAQKAKEKATDVLTQLQGEKDICMVGLWEYNPPAILAAVKDQGKLGQVKIVGFDENFETLQGIMEGHVEGTVAQQPYQFGYEAVKMLAAIAKGQDAGIPSNKIRYIPHRVITRDNAAEFKRELEGLLDLKKTS